MKLQKTRQDKQNKLNRRALGLAATIVTGLLISGEPASAQTFVDRQTVLQTSNAIENEVTAALKSFQRYQSAFYASRGRYGTTLREIGFYSPVVLADYGTLKILTTHPMGYMAEFVFSNLARARGLTRDRIGVTEIGIMGAPRYTTLTEAKTEITNYLRAAYTAQKAHIAEFGYPEINLMALGIRPLPHLTSLGQLKMEYGLIPPVPPLTAPNFSWKATFTPAEVGQTSSYAGGSIGTLTGEAMRPGPPLGQTCLDLNMVKIIGVTDLIYTIDQMGIIRTSSPGPKCFLPY